MATKLSIIIPAYNVEKYIDACLLSLCKQLNDFTELIIIDDKSTDHTLNAIKNRMEIYSDKRIKLIELPKNRGVAHARNKGLEIAQGEYIAFVDADDLVNRNYVASILQAIQSKCDYYKLSWNAFGNSNYSIKANALPKWNVAVWSRVFRYDIIVYRFREEYIWGEDGQFVRDNIKDGMNVGYILKPIYLYRDGREGSLSTVKGDKIRKL